MTNKKKIPDHAERVFKWEIFEIYQWEQELYDGSFATFEAVRKSPTVTVLALTKESKLLINKESQPNKWEYFWLITWRVEDWEDILETAKRELMEETGFSWELNFLESANSNMSKFDYEIYVYIAKNCEKVWEQNLDAGEKIETFEVPLDEIESYLEKPNFDKNVIPLIKKYILNK